MNKLKVAIVVFYAIALLFIGMSIFADRTLVSGIIISVIGYGSLLVGAVLSIIRTIMERQNLSLIKKQKKIKYICYICCFNICLILLLCMTACSDIYSEEIITDVEKYSDIWRISERRAFVTDHDLEPLSTFPNDISSLDVTEFYCWYANFRYTSSGFQIHLSVQYSEEDYASEMQRLAGIKVLHKVWQDTEKLSAPAYIAVWNWNYCYEYAICHDDSLTVDYVYLQLVNTPNIKLDSSLLPNNYTGMDFEDEPFSIYDD